MNGYTKGDYTKAYTEICEIWYEDNLYCIVRTSDADKIIGVLNENEELKRSFSFKDNLIRDLKYSMNRLSDENEELQQSLLDTSKELQYGVKKVQRLAKENEQLKHDATVLIQANQDYRKENEQLKSRINDYDVALKRLQDLADRKLKENEQLKQQKKGQELEIVRLHKLADAMSGVLRELGIYDVYNKEQINNVKKRLDK